MGPKIATESTSPFFFLKESLKIFLVLEKRSEYLKEVSLNLKSELNRQKAVVAKGVVDLSREESKNIKGLQTEHEHLCNSLHSLLNKLQVLSVRHTESNSNVSLIQSVSKIFFR